MNYKLKAILFVFVLGVAVCQSINVSVPTQTVNTPSCGPLHEYLKHRLTMYDECQTMTCCCEFLQRRPLLTVISIISGSNHCTSQLDQLLVKVNQKCVNQSTTFEDCPQNYRKYFIIRRKYVSNQIDDSSRPEIKIVTDGHEPQRIKIMRKMVGYQWMNATMLAIVLVSFFIVLIFLVKTVAKSELKEPINSIHNLKKKVVPNLYSSV